MKSIQLAIVLSSLSLGVYSGDGHMYGDTYQALTAKEKQALLWDAIQVREKTMGYYSFPFLFWRAETESMEPSIHWEGDSFEEKMDMRKKIIHTVGLVGKAVW